MADMNWIVAGLAATTGAIFLNLAASEAYDWCGWLAKRVMGLAIRRLPEAHRARYEEEWESHLADRPGKIGKLVHALGVLLSAERIRDESTREELRKATSIIIADSSFLFRIAVVISAIVPVANSAAIIGFRVSGVDLNKILNIPSFTLTSISVISVFVFVWLGEIIQARARRHIRSHSHK